MKNILILILLLTVNVVVWGQKREILKQNKFNSASFKPYEVEVKKKWFDSIKLYFPGDVEFVDERADKNKLGFVRMGEDNSFFNLLFPEQSIRYINSSFHHIIKPTNNNISLRIVIRHMWMSQIITEPTGKFTDNIYLCFCYFKADYYREVDGKVQLAGELDTVFSLRKWMGHASDDLMKKTLITALTHCDILPASSNPYYPVKLLYDSLDNQFNYPILKTAIPKKGIYLTYENFLNNNPEEADFEVKTKKGGTYLACNTIDTSVTNEAWGYSDGFCTYKHLNEDYYKMNRVQNTFELAGPRSISGTHTKKKIFFAVSIMVFFNGISPFMILPLFGFNTGETKIMRELVPYQLNIKEGTFY